MQFRRYIIPLAVTVGLALPATASAATGTIAVQSVDSNQVVANVSVTATGDDSYHGVSYWFAYVTQADGVEGCSYDSGIVMLSTSLTDGEVPRDADGQFTAPGSYTTTIKFTPEHSPQTRICVYAAVLSTTMPQLVAETVVDTPSSGRYRVGAICKDGWHSSATGSGACSSHGGVSYWLYSNPAAMTTPAPPAPVTPRPPIYATPLPTRTPTPPLPVEEAEPINQGVICGNHLVSKPRLCSIHAGRVKLSKLRWQSWGTTAKATGKVRINGGKLRTATITLSQPKPSTYTKMTIKMAHGKTRYLALRSN